MCVKSREQNQTNKMAQGVKHLLAVLVSSFVLLNTIGSYSLLTPSGRRPSVLFVISDDLRSDTVFSTNVSFSAPYSLPNIRRLMGTGVMFENAFSNFASCGPSRQSFLTGRTVDALGIWNQIEFFRQKGSAPRSFPEHLLSEGYTTISIGKVFHADPYYGVDEAYSWSETYFGAPSEVDSKCADGSYFCSCTDSTCADSRIAQKAASLMPRLSENHFSGTPFFLAVGFRRPHLDWRYPTTWPSSTTTGTFPLPSSTKVFPPKTPEIAYFSCDAMNERGEVVTTGQAPLSTKKQLNEALISRMRSAYWTAVSYMDAQLGIVLNALNVNSLERETIVVLLSDHGFSLGERGFWCKQTLQDIALRIPLIFSIPWLPRLRGTRSKDPIELLDLYPTFVSLLSMNMPDQCVNGVSF
jgi:iduronate 2-sulfatase